MENNDSNQVRRKSARILSAKKTENKENMVKNDQIGSESDTESDIDSKSHSPDQIENDVEYKKSEKKNISIPSKNKRPSTKKKHLIEHDGTIFDIVRTGASIETHVNEWFEEYDNDNLDAMVKLINFLIKACGCPGSIDRVVLEDQDLVTESLEELQGQFNLENQLDYPLIEKKGKKKNYSSKFSKNFGEFWSKWIAKCRISNVLYNNSSWCLELLKSWLVTMSSSSFKPFRHTSTRVALIVVSGLCEAAKNIAHDQQTAQKQLSTEEKKGTTPGNNRKLVLEQKVKDFDQKKDIVEGHLNDFFTSVFIHRYRDSDPVIRQECVKELGVWIKTYPEMYLDPQYLRYIGWMLSDKQHNVRLESSKSLGKLYENEAMITGLHQFTERFKTRILEMAKGEKEASVKASSVHLAVETAKAGLLEDKDVEFLMSSMFGENKPIREDLSNYFVDIFNEKYVFMIEEFKEDSDTIDEEYVGFRLLSELLSKYLLNAEEKKETLSKKHASGYGTSQFSEHSLSLGSQSTNLAFLNVESEVSELKGEEVVVNEETEFRRYQRALLLRSSVTDGWCDYFEADQIEFDTSLELIDFVRVHHFVQSLWGKLDLTLNWKKLCEYLIADFSEKGDRDSQLDFTERNLQIKFYGLSEDQECCLIYVLSSIILCSVNNSNEKQKTKAELKMEVSRELIVHLHKLLVKYGGEYGLSWGRKMLIESIILIRYIDLNVYIDMRMTKNFEVLLNELEKLFLKHSNSQVLEELIKTFQFLIGDRKNEVDADDEEQEKVEEMDSESEINERNPLVLQENAFDVLSGIYSVLLTEIEESSIKLNNELSDTNTISNLSERVRGLENSLLDNLKSNIKRLKYLGKVMDISKMAVFTTEKSLGRSAGSIKSDLDVFDVMNSVINGMLAILKVTKVDAEFSQKIRDTVLDKDTELKFMAEGIVENTLNIMIVLVTYNLSDCIDATTSSNDTMQLLTNKCDMIMNITEAIIVGKQETFSEEIKPDIIYFSLPLQLAALYSMTEMYLLVNGPITVQYPVFIRDLPTDVPFSADAIITRTIDLLGFSGNDEHSIELSSQQQKYFRHKFQCLVGVTLRLTCDLCYLRATAVSRLVSCFGITTKDLKKGIKYDFGKCYDEILRNLLNDILNKIFVEKSREVKVKKIVKKQIDNGDGKETEKDNEEFENEVIIEKKIMEVVEFQETELSDYFNMLRESLSQKLTIIKILKNFLKLGLKDILISLYLLKKNHLLVLEKKDITAQKKKIKRTNKIQNVFFEEESDEKEDEEVEEEDEFNDDKDDFFADGSFFFDDDNLDTIFAESIWGKIYNSVKLEKVLFGFKIYSKICLQVGEVIKSFGFTQDTILNDLSEQVSLQLKRFKPNKNSSSWQEYFDFIDSLNSEMHTTKKVKKVNDVGKKDKKIKSRRNRFPSKKLESIDEVDNEEEEATTKISPTRKSSRRSTMLSKTYIEGSNSDDNNAEEVEIPNNDKNNKKSNKQKNKDTDKDVSMKVVSSEEEGDDESKDDEEELSNNKRERDEERSQSPEILKKRRVML
ncbi:hypothetical protein HK099_007021 [Clydaea vesicula]|uniref:SCD domain-containing protein n=1 Tax=Clydaea vesicula TaxID=447962 RepID=A0AAD5Y0P9_9FUNG|nr:hypothetical protein HK099_007021 [Clydaea vesicula]